MAKLILTHEVTGLGAPGDVVEVKDGYARNYLFPRGFATQWSKGAERQIESIKAARAARELASLEDAQALAASLTSATVTVPAKAGAEGRLFGSIKAEQVADAVATRLNASAVIVVIECEHLCMAMRGIRKPGATTVTSAVRGGFRNDARTRAEAFSLIRGN